MSKGHAPDGHPRRCQIRARKGYQHLPHHERPFTCRNYARKGYKYCRFHNHGNIKNSDHKTTKMPDAYRVVSRTLMDRLKQLEGVEGDALNLRKELSLTRASAFDAIEKYGVALDMHEAAKGTGKAEIISAAESVVASAADAMREVLKEVRDCALDAARIEALTSGSFSITSVRNIVIQCARLMYDVCGEEHQHLAVQFEQLLATKIKVSVGETGTSLTPDQDVREMDDTVPRVEDDRAIEAE